MQTEQINKKILLTSITCTIIFTIIALTVGFFTSSQVILFDGIFNLIGVVLTYLSISAMKFIKKKDDWNYPFGKATFEPFIAIVQYAIILYICVTNITTAIDVILSGGHLVDISSGMLYGAFSVIFNLLVFLYLSKLAKKGKTAIAEVEIDQWKFSLLLGFGILIGFSISFFLSRTALEAYTAYIDPILTILITLMFSKTAIKAIKSCIRELMHAAPEPETFTFIKEKLSELKEKYEFTDKVLRLGKVGAKLIVEVDFIVKSGKKLDSILIQDELRRELIAYLDELPLEKWININFTSDKEMTIHD
ncbi:MAG: cation diffusion facilitator family transporter [Defluviitaleaceae bacterium]|nr:cation diffusion facilitator family transporter [Defluviitaleaceae bacterium]